MHKLINSGLVLKQESQVASSQPQQPFPSLRPHRSPPPHFKTFSANESTSSCTNDFNDNAVEHGDGNEHGSGSSSDGSHGWKPYEQREVNHFKLPSSSRWPILIEFVTFQSHFRPWISKSHTKYWGGLAPTFNHERQEDMILLKIWKNNIPKN